MKTKPNIIKVTKMKKSIICLAISTLFTIHIITAQEFKVGTNAINAGIGIGSSLSVYSGASEGIGFGASYERGIWDLPGPGVVSLGAYFGYKTFNYDGFYSDDYKWTYTIFGVRGAYHYTGLNVDNLDVYAGVMISYNNVSYNGSSLGSYSNGVGASGYVGGRWYFTESIAAFVEAGYGVSILNIGISFRF